MNWIIAGLFIVAVGFVVWVVLAGRKECEKMNNKKSR